MVQEILASGKYDSAIWTEGSPRIGETIYWLNLLVDTTVPICGNAAQRMHGMVSNDGPKNVIDSVDYIASRVRAHEQSRSKAGAVIIQEQRVFAARAVQKAECPAGRVCGDGRTQWYFGCGRSSRAAAASLSADRAAHLALRSEPHQPAVRGAWRTPGRLAHRNRAHSDQGPGGKLLGSAIPKVAVAKDANYWDEDGTGAQRQRSTSSR